MNNYEEERGSPAKRFGNPLPGDPSIMYTMQKNQLSELQQRFAHTVGLVQNATSNYQEFGGTGNFHSGTFAAGSRQHDSGNGGIPTAQPERAMSSDFDEAGAISAPTEIQNAEQNPINPLLTQKF